MLKYIIAKLTQYVDQQALGTSAERGLGEYMMKGIEIEHILPQTPKPELLQVLGEDYEEYMIKLGNLTLLERPMNVVAGNNFFEDKSKIYRTSKFYLTKTIAQKDTVGIDSSVNRINKLLKSFAKLGIDEIVERQKMLLGLAKRIWKIESLQ